MEKVAVYLKVYSNSKKEMAKERTRVENYCKNNNLKIVKTIEDFKDDNSFEGLCDYVSNKQYEIYNIVTNNFEMISKDIREVYDYYSYLDNYCYCNLITLDYGNQYHFEIILKKGIAND